VGGESPQDPSKAGELRPSASGAAAAVSAAVQHLVKTPCLLLACLCAQLFSRCWHVA
jgi:hypothetical protein